LFFFGDVGVQRDFFVNFLLCSRSFCKNLTLLIAAFHRKKRRTKIGEEHDVRTIVVNAKLKGGRVENRLDKRKGERTT
jgi:hypothetical protein